MLDMTKITKESVSEAQSSENRMPILQRAQIASIHYISMAFLSNVGVAFNEEEALAIIHE